MHRHALEERTASTPQCSASAPRLPDKLYWDGRSIDIDGISRWRRTDGGQRLDSSPCVGVWPSSSQDSPSWVSSAWHCWASACARSFPTGALPRIRRIPCSSNVARPVFYEKPWPSRAVGRRLERLGREAHLRLGLCVGDEPAPIGCQNRNTTSRPTVQPVMFEPHTYDEPIPIHWTFQS